MWRFTPRWFDNITVRWGGPRQQRSDQTAPARRRSDWSWALGLSSSPPPPSPSPSSSSSNFRTSASLHHGFSPDSRSALRRINFVDLTLSYHGNIPSVRSAPWICTALMETMSPQQGTMGQNRSDSLTGESKALTDSKKVTIVGADGDLTVDTCAWCFLGLVRLIRMNY